MKSGKTFRSDGNKSSAASIAQVVIKVSTKNRGETKASRFRAGCRLGTG